MGMPRLASGPVGIFLLGAFLIVATSGCIQIRPVPMDIRVDTIPDLQKLPIKVAVVVPDPPTHRIMYTPPAATGRTEPVDQTEQMNEAIWPLGRELAKSSRAVFSQVFSDAANLRSLPLPGEYDAVIQPKIEEVRIKGFMESAFASVNSWQNLSYQWAITVLDKEGIPILSKKGTTPIRRIDVEASFSTQGYVRTLGAGSSELMGSMVKDWGTMLALSPEIRTYVEQQQR